MSAIPRPTLPSSVAVKLRGLRSELYTWLGVHGLGVALMVLWAMAAASLLLDWWFRLDRISRAILLLVCAASLAVVVYRRLFRPLAQAVPDDALAMRVERQHRELGESLISALQFSRLGDVTPMGVSPAMVDAAIRQGAERSGLADFGRAISPRFRKEAWNLALSAAGIIVTVIWVFAAPVAALKGYPAIPAHLVPADALRASPPPGGYVGFERRLQWYAWLWLDRNILLKERNWPQLTHLHIRGVTGDFALPRGDDLDQIVEVQGKHPSTVQVEVKFHKTGNYLREELPQQGDDTQQLAYRLLLRNVLEDLEYRVRGGDGATPWYQVKLVDRPSVRALQLTYTPPDYTGDKPRKLASGDVAHDILAGGSVELVLESSKPLSRADLLLGKEVLGTLQPAPGQAMPGATRFVARFREDAAPGGQTFLLRSGTYGVMLTDNEQPSPLATKRPTQFAFRLVPDREPSVRGKLDGIGTMVTTRATIPINFNLSDDFALTAVGLSHTYQAGVDNTSPKTTEERVIDVPLLREIDPATQKPVIVRSLDHRYLFEVADLKPVEDSSIQFHIFARDNRVGGAGPNQGKCPDFYVKVVPDKTLGDELTRRQQEQRQEYERLLADQEKMKLDAQLVLAEVKNTGSLSAEKERELTSVEKRQRLAAERNTLIARQFQQILAELLNNKLDQEGSQPHRAMQNKVIDEMLILAQREVPVAANHLDSARRSGLTPEQRIEQLEKGIAQQEAIAGRMREILAHIVRGEGYQVAVNFLREIYKLQDDVTRATFKAHQQAIEESVFGPRQPK